MRKREGWSERVLGRGGTASGRGRDSANTPWKVRGGYGRMWMEGGRGAAWGGAGGG